MKRNRKHTAFRGIILIIFRAALLLPVIVSAEAEVYTFTADEAMGRALRHSNELRRENLLYAAEVRKFRLSLREFLPRFSVAVSDDTSVIKNMPDIRTKRVSLSVTQPVFRGGNMLSNRRLKRLELELQRQLLKQIKHNLENTVWELFHHIVIQKEKLNLQQQSGSLTEHHLTVANREYEMGKISELEKIDTELKVKELELSIEEIKTTLTNELFSLKRQLNIPVTARVELQADIDASYDGIDIHRPPRFYYALALDENMSIEKARLKKKQQAQIVKTKRNHIIPYVELEGTLFFEGRQLPLQRPGFKVIASFSFPSPVLPVNTKISAGMRGEKEVSSGLGLDTSIAKNITAPIDERVATLNLRSGQLDLEERKELLRFELYQTIEEYKHLQKKKQVTRERVSLQTRRLYILETKLKLGEVRRIDYLDAELETLAGKLNLLELTLELIMKEREIEKLIGLSPGMLRAFEHGGGDARGETGPSGEKPEKKRGGEEWTVKN